MKIQYTGLVLYMLVITSLASAQESRLKVSMGAFRFNDNSTYLIDPIPGKSDRLYLIEYETGKRFLLEKQKNSERYTHPSSGFSLDRIHDEWIVRRKNKSKDEYSKKITLREDTTYFKSGDIKLFGKLVKPDGNGKFPVVVIAHGSDNDSAVDNYFEPYLFASQGIACFVYDKRGTGKSEGQPILSFKLLSDDLVAAVEYLKNFENLNLNEIGLSGYSQGGWIAPLAAAKSEKVKFIVVNYGMAMSVAEEDFYEAPLKLADMGVSEIGLKEFKDLNSTLHRVVKNDFVSGWIDTLKFVYNKYSNKPWMDSLKKTQTWAGSLANMPAQMGWEQVSKIVPDIMRTLDPFYDPATTLSKLDIPMLWLVGDADIEAPPDITIKLINRMRQKEHKPFELKIYKNADHGLRLFERNGSRRIYTNYAPRYFQDVVSWIKKQ